MKKLALVICLSLCLFSLPFSSRAAAEGSTPGNAAPNVIPNIQQWTGGQGDFLLGDFGRICYDDASLLDVAEVLSEDLAGFTRIVHSVVSSSAPQAGDIYLTLQCSDISLGEEGYIAEIGDSFTVRGRSPAGVFYGTRTLLQILRQDPAYRTAPRGTIRDFPKLQIRSFMLDVARKYFTEDYLVNYVKQLAWLKYNELHLHLTDDQGFRLKSDVYPIVSSEQGYDKVFIRQLQDIAARYFIDIVPEIDLPGHASAIVRAYPELGHAPGTALNPDKPGLRPIDLSKDASYEFAKAVLDEWVPLFDSEYFHIGGDEYPGYGAGEGLNNLLKQYPELLAKARSLGMQTEADLFYYFLNTMGDYVETKYGKTARFWEWAERFEPYTSIDLENDMIFDAWEGPEAISRSQQGFKIINSNWKSTYIVPGTNMYPDM